MDLIVVGDPEIAKVSQKILKNHKIKYLPAENIHIWQALQQEHFDLIILPLNNEEDFKRFVKIKSLYPRTPILITADEKTKNTSLVVKTIKEGAHDFIEKPVNFERLLVSVNNAINYYNLRNEIDYLRRQQDVVYNFDDIIAESPVMKELITKLKKFSRVDATILITGETGTGKSFLSGAIHFNSNRRDKPFVKINCANIPEQLLESELFGHEKGAFTGAVKTRIGRIEQARGGTVFLDEIAEMPLSLQAKLLRFLEEKKFERLGSNATIEVDVRVIAATNKDIVKMVKNGQFREDLYYRLNVIHIHVPPLRERKECLKPLAYKILKEKSKILKKNISDFEPRAMEKILNYHWPGNIRQLSNVIERAVILEEDPVIRAEHILIPNEPKTKVMPKWKRGLSEEERQNIIEVLAKHNWVQKKAAEELNISPRVLNYKIRKYNITHPTWHIYK